MQIVEWVTLTHMQIAEWVCFYAYANCRISYLTHTQIVEWVDKHICKLKNELRNTYANYRMSYVLNAHANCRMSYLTHM